MSTYYVTAQNRSLQAKGAPRGRFASCYGYVDFVDNLQEVYNGLVAYFINKDGTLSYTKSLLCHLLQIYGHLHAAEEQTISALQKIETNEILPIAEHIAIVEHMCNLCKTVYASENNSIKQCILQVITRHKKRGHPKIDSDYKLGITAGRYNNLFCGYLLDARTIYVDNRRNRRIVYNKDGSESITKGLVFTAIAMFISEECYFTSARSVDMKNLADALYTLQNNEIANTAADLQIVKDIIADFVPQYCRQEVFLQLQKSFAEYYKAMQTAA